MDELRSRRYASGEKDIIIFFKDCPDAADGFAGYVTGSGLPHEAVLCMDSDSFSLSKLRLNRVSSNDTVSTAVITDSATIVYMKT